MVFATSVVVLALLKVAMIDSVDCDQWERLGTPAWEAENCAHVQAWHPPIYFDLCRITVTYKSAPDLFLSLEGACSFVHPYGFGVEIQR